MCEQNLPKLWRWYEFTVHNHLWNSEIVPQWIQHKISKKVTETDSQKRLSNSKTVNNTELFTLTMCLSACLWVPIAKTPFNYTITAQTLLAKCVDYRFQRSILQFPALGKKYRIASMFIINRALSTPWDVDRRECGSMFCETIEIISWSSYESSRKHGNIALKTTMTERWSSLTQQ